MKWSGPVNRRVQFYIWKLVSGKAHGGQHLRVDDINIYFETFGAGPLVLVLHGGLVNQHFQSMERSAQGHR